MIIEQVYPTGNILTYQAYRDGSEVTGGATSLPEVPGTYLYRVDDENVHVGDMVVIFDGGNFVGGGEIPYDISSGVELTSTGLDNIPVTEPSGRASTFREMLVQSWMRFFNKVTLDNNYLKVYKSNGSVNTTQDIEDNGTSQKVDKS